MQPSAPGPDADLVERDAVPDGERLVQAVDAAVRVAVEVAGGLVSMASSAAGNGGNGPSFEASLTTRSRPSSRWTSSTGLPGWYGVRPLMLGRKKASPKSSNPLVTLQDPTPV